MVVDAGSPSIWAAAASVAGAAGSPSARACARFEERPRRVDIHGIRAFVRTCGVAR